MGNFIFGKPKPPLRFKKKLKLFLTAHWRGVVIFLAPIVLLLILIPDFLPYQWCAYCLALMAVYWVTECMPLPVTAFLPILIFPLAGVMSTKLTCECYINNMIMMFIGSMVLAYAIEQSGLHVRIALGAIRIIGYSHYKLLFAICFITMFVSMWITNTAATTMMVPIVFAVLKVLEGQRMLAVYELDSTGERVASDLTSCYFCAVTFSATIGGIGTLVGTATNLVFKGLLMKIFPNAPDYLNFPYFSAFAVPYMLCMEICTYLYLIAVYFGFCRPNSIRARRAAMTDEAVAAAKDAVASDWKKLGKFTVWEGFALVLFALAMILFFLRSPQMFTGWSEILGEKLNYDSRIVKDSAVAMLVGFLMLLVPSSLAIFKNCKAKYYQDLPKGRIKSVLDWPLMNNVMPYSFVFLLGGGFALSQAASAQFSDLNGKIGNVLKELQVLPNSAIILLLIIITVFITNFASNVAVCTVITPIAMRMAVEIKVNPLWYNLATGFAASYCFLLPVGTPGNLIVQSAANIPTRKMIVAGIGSTIASIFFTWIFIILWAPVIWPDLNNNAEWAI